MKIFWSWQSDTPGKTGRHFIREALDAAVEELKRDLTLVEPGEREAVTTMHIDQDRQGLTGSFDLARSILDKIDTSDFFVADVTSIGIADPKIVRQKKNEKTKQLINSNVALELGYAYRAINNSFVLLVMNDHYGKHEDLPFDLRHKGGTVVFTLAPDAAKTEIERAGGMLKKRFVAEIKSGLAVKTKTKDAEAALPAPAFSMAPTVTGPALYFEKGEVLASAGEPGEQEFVFKEDRAAYLRIFPVRSARPPGTAKVVQEFNKGRAMPLSERDNGIIKRNKYGAITFDFRGRNTMTALTQGFATGELWGINGIIIHPLRVQGVEHTIIQVINFEKIFVKALRNYVAISTQIYAFEPPFTVVLGVYGLTNTFLLAPNGDGSVQQWGPIYEEAFQRTETLTGTDDDSIKSLLRKFFADFYDLSASPRSQILASAVIAAHDLPPR